MKRVVSLATLFAVLFFCIPSSAVASTYNPYKKPLKNKHVEKKEFTYNNIEITRNQYVPKTKLKRNCDCYEYLITNKSAKDILLIKVETTDFLSLNQSAGRALKPTFIDFVPVVNIFFAIPVDLEKNKFTRPLPFELNIPQDESVRILAITDKDKAPVVDFYFEIDKEESILRLNGDMKNEKL